MDVQEVKQRIATMTAAELAEVESFIHVLMSDRDSVATPSGQDVSFEEAAAHVRTGYSHLLHKLSQ
jgi:hypothetical protein